MQTTHTHTNILALAAVITITLTLAADNLYAVWSAPQQNPPDGNVAAPIHTGSATQLKNGVLGANELAGFEKVRSNQYCDIEGNNCTNVADLGGGATGDTFTTLTTGAVNSTSWLFSGSQPPSLRTVTGKSMCFLTRKSEKKKSKYYYNYGSSCDLRLTNASTGQWSLRASAEKNVSVYCQAMCR